MRRHYRLVCHRLGFFAMVAIAVEVLVLALKIELTSTVSSSSGSDGDIPGDRAAAGTAKAKVAAPGPISTARVPRLPSEGSNAGGTPPSKSSEDAPAPRAGHALVDKTPPSPAAPPAPNTGATLNYNTATDGKAVANPPAGCFEASKKSHSDLPLLQVVFAAEADMVQALQAGIASVVTSSSQPTCVVVHVMVLREDEAAIREGLGFVGPGSALRLQSGSEVIIHPFSQTEVAPAVPIVPQSVQKTRGKLDSPLNYVRFYLHVLLHKYIFPSSPVMIYLDTDIIVKADLRQLAVELQASGKTIGFVRRSSNNTFPASQMIGKPKPLAEEDKDWCVHRSSGWADLMHGHTYNAGVLAINLKRWEHQKLTDRVEKLVKEHNKCGGSLWLGGSQPPLLLAFLELPLEQREDFIEFPKTWNYGQLGYKDNILKERLKQAALLHWTGPRKPWREKGLYRDIWLPYLHRWRQDLLPATLDDDSGAGCSLVMVAPNVPSRDCALEGRGWTCSKDLQSVDVRSDCGGLFELQAKPIFCLPSPTLQKDQAVTTTQCKVGSSLASTSFCEEIMLLSTFFVSIADWQKKRSRKVAFSKIQTFYFTAMTNGLRVTMFHDGLSEDFIQHWQSKEFQFMLVDMARLKHNQLGVNDVRYFFFREAVEAHPEWTYVFILDAFDLRVAMSPCKQLLPDRLYIGKEETRVRRNIWLGQRFKDMGGVYETWWRDQPESGNYTLNCGITGGHRDIVLRLLRRMQEVLLDKSLAVRVKSSKSEVNVNMAALNYIAYTDFPTAVVTGPPVHSRYWKAEKHRTDVWFIHK